MTNSGHWRPKFAEWEIMERRLESPKRTFMTLALRSASDRLKRLRRLLQYRVMVDPQPFGNGENEHLMLLDLIEAGRMTGGGVFGFQISRYRARSFMSWPVP